MIENPNKRFCILNKFLPQIFILGCFILIFNLFPINTIKGSIAQISLSDTTITICGKILDISRVGIKSNYPNGKWSITEGPATNISGNTFYATFSELKSGSNTFIWTADNNQEKITLRVNNNQPIAKVYKPSSIICGTQLLLKSENAQKYLPLAKGRWIASKQPIENKDSLAFLNNNQIISTNKDTVSTLSYNLKVTGAYSFIWMVTHPDCPTAKDSIQIINRRNIAEIVSIDNSNILTCGLPITVSTKNVASFSKPTWLVKKVPEIGVQEPVYTKQSTTSTTINWQWLNFTKPGSYDLLYIVKSENALECPSDTASYSILNIKPLAELEYTSQFLEVCGKTQLKAKKPSLSGAGLSGKWILERKPIDAANINTDNLQFNSSVNFSKPGSYYFKWYVQKDSPLCTSDTALIIFNNIKPSIVNAGKDSTVCSNIYDLKGSDLNIEQLPNTRGYWSIYSRPAQTDKIVFDDSSRARAIVSNLNKIGSYGFVWNVVTSTSALSSCISSDSVIITSYLHPEFNNSDIKYFCDTLQLFPPQKVFPSGNIIPTESWQVSENYNVDNAITIFKAETNGIKASGFNKPGIYKFDYTFSYGGCETKTTLTTQNLKPSPFSIYNKGRDFCTDSIKLTAPLAEKDFQGKWKSVLSPNMPLPIFANSNLGDTYVKGFDKPGAYMFQWVVSSPLSISCSRDSDTITFFNQKASVLPPSYKADSNFCGTAFNIKNPTLDDGFLSKNANWSIISSESKTIKKTINGDVITYSNILQSGKIKLVWSIASTIDLSCIRRDTIVRINQQPNVINAAGNDMEVCGKKDSVRLMALTNPMFPLTKGKWKLLEKPIGANLPIFLGDSSNANLKLSGFNKSGIYRFSWTQTNFGCSETDEIKIINKAPDTIFAKSLNKFTCGSQDSLFGYNPKVLVEMKDAKFKWRIINQPSPTPTSTKAIITDSLSPSTTITDMSYTGIYRMVYFIQNSNCLVSDTVNINRSKRFPATVPKALYHTCEDSLIIESNNSVAPGRWGISGGAQQEPIFLDPNNPNRVLVKGFSVVDSNEYIWIVEPPGCFPSTATVVVKKYPKFGPVSFNKREIKICENDSITLQPILKTNNSMLPEWYRKVNNKDSLFSREEYPKITKLEYGQSVFKFRWTQPEMACTSNFDNVTIVRDSGFQTNIKLNYMPILCNSSMLVSTNAIFNGKYKWIASPSNPNPIYPLTDTVRELYFNEFDKAGLYRIFLEISRGACIFKDTVIVERKISPSKAQIISPTFTNDTICEQKEPHIFQAEKPKAGSIGYWAVNNIVDLTDTNTTKSLQLLPGRQVNVIWLTTYNGSCPSQDQRSVYVTKKPSTSYAGENFTTYASSGRLNALSQNLSTSDYVQWITPSNNNTVIKEINNPKSEFTNLPIGENIFCWKISNSGCPSSVDTIIITRLQSQIPKAFSPNNDNKNESFNISGIEDYPNSRLQVFNRWGDLVYENNNYNNDWKGESKDGRPLPDDTYYYVLKLGQEKESKNFVIIKR